MIYKLLVFLTLSVSQFSLASPYDQQVMADHPVAYLPLTNKYRVRFSPDISGHGHTGQYGPVVRVPPQIRMPNGDGAIVFDGSNYVEIASHPELSVAKTGVLTLEAWIRPSTLQFQNDESDGYVYFFGKGEPGEHEYAARMYSKNNSVNRPNRISGYAFNLNGGLGSGAYFQDPLAANTWIHVAIVINKNNRSSQFPTGYVRIYKNAVLRQTVGLDQFNVNPQFGTAPLRIGTRDMNSFFEGAIGKFAVYDYELSAQKLLTHYSKM